MARKNKKYVDIYNDISSKISSNELIPGSKLAGITLLSKKYNVAPITVGRAVEELVKSGLLKVKLRSGTYVVDRRVLKNIIVVLPAQNAEYIETYMGVKIFSELDQTVCRSMTPEQAVEALNKENDIDGMIITAREDVELLELAARANIQAVSVADTARISDYSVGVNYYDAVRDLTVEFLQRKVKHPLFVADAGESENGFSGFQTALKRQRLPVVFSQRVLSTMQNLYDDVSAKLKDEGFDGILSASPVLSREILKHDFGVPLALMVDTPTDAMNYCHHGTVCVLNRFYAGQRAYELLIEAKKASANHLCIGSRHWIGYSVMAQQERSGINIITASDTQKELIFLHGQRFDIMQHPYYRPVIEYLNFMAQSTGCFLRLMRTGLPLISLSNNTNYEFKRMWAKKRIGGIFLHSIFHEDNIKELLDADMPFVGLGSNFSFNSVESPLPIAAISNYLKQQKCRSIGIISKDDPNYLMESTCPEAVAMTVENAVQSADAVIVTDDFIAWEHLDELNTINASGRPVFVFGNRGFEFPSGFRVIYSNPEEYAEAVWKMFCRQNGTFKKLPSVVLQQSVSLDACGHGDR